MDITRADQRGFATGVNEFAGYAAVGIGGLVTGYLAVIYGPREALFGFGLSVIVTGMLTAFFFIKETLPWAKVESKEHSSGSYVGHKPRFPTGVSAHPGTWEIFTLVSFRHPTLNALCQAGVTNKIADSLLWVLFPVFLHNQGLNIVQIGWITAIYGMVWGAAQLLTGALSDAIGRKKPIIGGLWLLGIGIAAVPLVHDMTAWAICAVIMGIGMALLYPNLIAALADISHPNWRSSALGTYRYWRDTGYAIGAIVLGLVAQWTSSIENAFWFTAIILGVSGVYLALRAEETHPRINPADLPPAQTVASPTLDVRVISQTPPGGRCGLYTGYGQALAQHLGVRFQLDISTERDAHGHGFPSIWINGSPLRPSDGVIVMPEDIVEVLVANKIKVSNDLGLALIAEVNRMLHEGG